MKKLRKRAKKRSQAEKSLMQQDEEFDVAKGSQVASTFESGVNGRTVTTDCERNETEEAAVDHEAKAAEIAKRKSFAEMKLAEVASGGSFSFAGSIPLPGDEDIKEEEDSDGGDGDDDGLRMTTKPQQQESSGSSSFDSPDSPKSPASDMAANGGAELGTHKLDEEEEEAISLEGALSARDGSPRHAKQKLDPIIDVCPDLEVKIADLGNACWVVSLESIYILLQ